MDRQRRFDDQLRFRTRLESIQFIENVWNEYETITFDFSTGQANIAE
jgi:hypothetical protein